MRIGNLLMLKCLPLLTIHKHSVSDGEIAVSTIQSLSVARLLWQQQITVQSL
jgi:hypothetical protein